jgi:hypothetical protein
VDNIHRLSAATPYTPNDGSIGLAGPIAIPASSERSRWWVELLVIVWLCWVYDAITNLAPLRRAAALSHARGVMSLERTLHIDPELTLNRWLSGHHTLGLILSDYYDNAHFVVTLGLLGWLWFKRADIYRPLRNSLVLINVIGFVVFWRYPVAPPRMLVGVGFSDVVASTHAFGSWHTGSLASEANQLAAMPSLHIAWAVWCTLALWRLSKRPWLRLLAVLYPLLTTLVVLATGNHFLLDALAGLLTTVAAVLVVKVAANINSERPPGNRRARNGTLRRSSRSTPVAESPRLSPSDATQG